MLNNMNDICYYQLGRAQLASTMPAVKECLWIWIFSGNKYKQIPREKSCFQHSTRAFNKEAWVHSSNLLDVSDVFKFDNQEWKTIIGLGGAFHWLHVFLG